MAYTTTPVRPSNAPGATTAGLAPTRRAMTRGERDRLTSDLRMAFMRISRRVRFQTHRRRSPGTSSPCSPSSTRRRAGLAAPEKVSAPSMTRTVAALEQVGLVARTDHPSDGRSVILSLTLEARRPSARSGARATSGSPRGSRSSPRTSARCWRRPPPC